MTDALTDDYTVFLEPLLGEPLREELAGEYEGIGIWVEQPGGEFTIIGADSRLACGGGRLAPGRRDPRGGRDDR